MPAGKVKFYDDQRGFGFIRPESGGEDLFVHVSAVERAGLASLYEGQPIEFDIEPGKKGRRQKAVNLVVSAVEGDGRGVMPPLLGWA